MSPGNLIPHAPHAVTSSDADRLFVKRCVWYPEPNRVVNHCWREPRAGESLTPHGRGFTGLVLVTVATLYEQRVAPARTSSQTRAPVRTTRAPMAFATRAPFTTLGRLRSRLVSLAPQVGRFANDSLFWGTQVAGPDLLGRGSREDQRLSAPLPLRADCPTPSPPKHGQDPTSFGSLDPYQRPSPRVTVRTQSGEEDSRSHRVALRALTIPAYGMDAGFHLAHVERPNLMPSDITDL